MIKLHDLKPPEGSNRRGKRKARAHGESYHKGKDCDYAGGAATREQSS